MTKLSFVQRCLLLCLAIGVAGCSGLTGPSDNVQLAGTVYASFGPNPSNRAGPGLYSGPVAGAVLSTSLDSVTATTDASGNFTLITQTRRQKCQPYTVTIRAAGFPTYSVLGTWAPTGQLFALNPPTPSAAETNTTCR